MGQPLVSILSKKGYNVFVTSRKTHKDIDNVKYLYGNAMEDSFLASILNFNRWDAIVDFMVYPVDKFKTRIENFVNSTNQYVFISSCRVFADYDEYITENSPRLLDVSKDDEYLKTDEYALRKAREEDVLKNYKNITIVRPSVTFNDNRLQLGVYEASDWIDRILHNKTVVFSKDIASHYTTLTHGEDVAIGIAGLIGNPMAIGEDFNIVTNESFTWQQVLDTYIETLKENNLRPKIIYTEEALNLRIKKWQYQVKYARLFNRKFNNEKILKAVPELKFRNVKIALKQSLSAYLSNTKRNLTISLVSLLQDRESGDLSTPFEFSNIIEYSKYLILRFMPYSLLLKRIER